MYQQQRKSMTQWGRWGVLLIVFMLSVIGQATRASAWSVDFIWYPSDDPAAVGTCLAGTPTTFEASLSGSDIPASVSYTWFFAGGNRRYTNPAEYQFDTPTDTNTVMVKAWETGNAANERIMSHSVPVLADTYIITVIPSAGGTVKGPVGEEGEEIVCTEGSPQAQCQETYQNERGVTLKAEIEPGWVLLGWDVNGQMVETTSNIIEISGDADVAGIFEQQTVFLTFDDGPLYGTDDVIRILGEEEVEGTFFMVGVHITPWGVPYVEAAYSDFEIGNHSFSHPWQTSDVVAYYNGPASVVLDDFQNNDITLSNTLSISPPTQFVVSRLPTKNTWRIPGIITFTDGSGGPAADLLQNNGYIIYGWDVEWHRSGIHPQETPEKMVEIVGKAFENETTRKKNKIIVLMHDTMFKQSEGDDVKLRQFIQLLKELDFGLIYVTYIPKYNNTNGKHAV